MSEEAKQPLLGKNPSYKITLDKHPRLSSPRIQFPSASSSSLARGNATPTGNYEQRTDEYGTIAGDGEEDEDMTENEAGLRSLRRARPSDRDVEFGGIVGKREGTPKVTYQCLVSEFKCYGSYILPTFLVFGVLAIGICLIVYGSKKGWFDRS